MNHLKLAVRSNAVINHMHTNMHMNMSRTSSHFHRNSNNAHAVRIRIQPMLTSAMPEPQHEDHDDDDDDNNNNNVQGQVQYNNNNRVRNETASWQPYKNVDIQRVTQTAIIHEITHQQSQTIAKVVPWFLANMPSSYFNTVPEEFRLDHMKAVSAIQDANMDLHLNLKTHLPDGRLVLTYIRPGKADQTAARKGATGRILNLVKDLPWNHNAVDYLPLSRVQVFNSEDHSMSISIFVFGEEGGSASASASNNIDGANMDASASASASASAPTTTFHYTLGVGMIFLSLALIVFESTIASKWTGMGDGVYVDDKHNGRKVDTRTREEMDDDEETELIARHLDSSKILESIQMTCSEISQNRLKKKSSHRMNLRKTIKSSNTSIDKKKADDGTEIQMVSMKQRRNVVVYLNALAMKLSRHRQSHHHNHNHNHNRNRTTQNDGNDNVNVNPDEIYLICQEAAFKTLIAFQSIDIDTDIDGDANTDDSISSKNMNMDAIYSAAIALLALTAKNPSVQHRSISNPDVYGIQIVIDIMVHSLKRAKADANSNSNDNSNNNNNKNRSGEKKNYERVEKESIAAELQRKACLYLGAISDGNSAMAHAIGVGSESGSKKSSMGGLEAILQSMLWFRYHGEVINWALWALFILCYDESGTEDDKTSTKSSGKNGEHGNGDNMNVGKTNQNLLVRMDGIDKICTVMRNILHDLQKDNDDDSGDCNADDNDLRKAAATRSARMAQKENAKEVSRHGLSLLFDILRQRQNFENIPTYMRNKYDNDAELDAMHIRRIALNAGLHDVLKHAMVECSDVSDIMMMGQQMLICTGYKGDVPCFDGKMVPFSK